MPSADCYTDRRLVRTKLNITVKMNRTEHYSMLFGDKRHVSEESLANVPQKTIREELDYRPTSVEIETAISKLKKKHKALMDFPLKYLKWVVSP
nr:Biomphalaria glabrata craniofacial development protein 2-like [Biomphalaria glabrata]